LGTEAKFEKGACMGTQLTSRKLSFASTCFRCTEVSQQQTHCLTHERPLSFYPRLHGTSVPAFLDRPQGVEKGPTFLIGHELTVATGSFLASSLVNITAEAPTG
jgi:hypothetical protein